MLYIALSLVSPAALPDAMVYLHLNLVLGILVIITMIPGIPGSGIGAIPESYLGLGLIAGVILSQLFSGWAGRIFETLGLFLPIVFTYYFVALTCSTLRRLKILSAVLALVALFVVAHGMLANFSGDVESPYLLVENQVLLRIRGLGVINDPNDLAQVLVTVIPLLFLRWKKGGFAGNLLFTLLPAALLLIGVFYTHSRGGAVALLAVLFFALKEKLGVITGSIFAALSAVGLVAGGISGGRGMNEDDGGRVALWQKGIEIIRAHPLVGVGMGNYGQFTDSGLTAHNSYVLCAAELGFFGYFFWLGMIVAGWTGLTQMIRLILPKQVDAEDSAVLQTPSSSFAAHTPQSHWVTMSDASMSVAPGGVAAMVMPGVSAYDRNSAAASHPSAPWQDNPEPGDEEATAREMASAARIIRIAGVGLLVSSFFLSRAFSMSFYIIFGMMSALKMAYWRSNPQFKQDTNLLLKRTIMIMFGSVIGLYLYIRVHGVR